MRHYVLTSLLVFSVAHLKPACEETLRGRKYQRMAKVIVLKGNVDIEPDWRTVLPILRATLDTHFN